MVMGVAVSRNVFVAGSVRSCRGEGLDGKGDDDSGTREDDVEGKATVEGDGGEDGDDEGQKKKKKKADRSASVGLETKMCQRKVSSMVVET